MFIFTDHKLLGEGTYAKTYLVPVKDEALRKKYNADKVVVKVPHKDKREAMKAIEKEVTLFNIIKQGYLKKVTNEFIVQYFDLEMYKDSLAIVMEYVPNGNLRDKMMQGNKPVRMDLDAALEMMKDLLSGVKFLHSRKIFHRDLKPENILIVEYEMEGKIYYRPKISDFGCSRLLSRDETAITVLGTPQYIAPEMLTDMKKISFHSDIWSLGVIFYEMLTGKMPYECPDMTAGVSNILYYFASIYSDGSIQITAVQKLNPKVPPGIAQFVEKCLEVDPDKRFKTVTEAEKELLKQLRLIELQEIGRVADDEKAYIQKIKRFIRTFPQEAKGYELLGNVHAGHKNYSQAKQEFEEGLQQCPESADLHYYIGQILDQTGEIQKARWYFEKALEHGISGKRKNYVLLRLKKQGH
jgi:serine/threonine protein kinase